MKERNQGCYQLGFWLKQLKHGDNITEDRK